MFRQWEVGIDILTLVQIIFLLCPLLPLLCGSRWHHTFCSAQYLVNYCLILTKFSLIYHLDITKNIRCWWPWPNFKGHTSKKTENSRWGHIFFSENTIASFLWDHWSHSGYFENQILLLKLMQRFIYSLANYIAVHLKAFLTHPLDFWQFFWQPEKVFV